MKTHQVIWDEDPKDGIDNDRDGRIDEDPFGGWDEDIPDGRDNDGDGRVDEDGPDPVDASKGEVILYDPDLEAVANWDLKSLLCLEHNANDGLVASLEGVKHGVLVRVPVSLMEKAGTYYFVLHFLDNHPDKYKDHQVKPALEMNQTAQQLPPIVYIHYEKWHVAWCLPGRGVQFRTVRANPAEHCVVRDFTNATPQSHVRAAINGGFFSPIRVRGENGPKTNSEVQMIAEVGTGTAGNWRPYGIPLPATGDRARPGRWCFGINATGGINAMLMRARREGRRRVYRVHRQIERSFPFGLSNVGLLVRGGQDRDPPSEWPSPNEHRGRTALAWMRDRAGGQHIFFVTVPDGEGATWEETATFIITNLPQILRTNYRVMINSSTINAVMLDGGGSTKFGYRLNPRNPSTYQGFHRHHDRRAPNSPRYLTTYITAEANFPEP